MSGWRAIVNELHAQGGGPLPGVRFNVLCAGWRSALNRARDLGLIGRAGSETENPRRPLWLLTRRGRDLVEGRVALASGCRGNGRARATATWLAALPPRNEVRIGPALAGEVGENPLP